MGERALSKLQAGLETVNGTAVAADTLLAGAEITAVAPDRTPSFPEDNLGVRGRSSRVRADQFLVNNTIRVPQSYFQLLPLMFSMGLQWNITPVEQNTPQADWLWTFLPSMTATNAIDSITLEVGDNVDAYEVEYTMFERIRLAGGIAQAGEEAPVEFEGDYFGRQITKGAFTGSIAVPSMQDANAKLSRFYVDTTWAGRGTTEVVDILRGWDLEILTGAHPKFFGSGNQTFDAHGESFIDVMLTLIFEGGTTADTEFDTFKARTQQAVTVKLNSGVAIGSGDNHNFEFSLWGAYESVTPLDAEDRGNNLYAAVFHGLYDPTGAQIVEFLVTTDVAAI